MGAQSIFGRFPPRERPNTMLLLELQTKADGRKPILPLRIIDNERKEDWFSTITI